MEVMRTSGLQTIYEHFRSLVGVIFTIPRTLFRKCFVIQIQILSLPVRLASSLFRLLSRRNHSEQSIDVPSSSQPSSEVIVMQTKRLRNSVAMSIAKFNGVDLFWDAPLLEEKVTRFSEAFTAGDSQRMAVATRALEEHPVCISKPLSKEQYNRLMQTERGIERQVNETVSELRSEARRKLERMTEVPEESVEDISPVQVTGMCDSSDKSINDANAIRVEFSNLLKSKKNIELILKSTEREKVNTKVRRGVQMSLYNRCLKNHLLTTNSKLEEVLKSSNTLLEEISKLNGQFDRLANATTKLTKLESELTEGKKTMNEIEEERDEMRLKLLALEELIKEEEIFLDDLTNESGFEEATSDSHDEL